MRDIRICPISIHSIRLGEGPEGVSDIVRAVLRGFRHLKKGEYERAAESSQTAIEGIRSPAATEIDRRFLPNALYVHELAKVGQSIESATLAVGQMSGPLQRVASRRLKRLRSGFWRSVA